METEEPEFETFDVSLADAVCMLSKSQRHKRIDKIEAIHLVCGASVKLDGKTCIDPDKLVFPSSRIEVFWS